MGVDSTKEKEQNMMYFYYHKDHYGIEKSYSIEDYELQDDKMSTLRMLVTDTDGVAYEFVFGNNFWGYATIEEARDNESENEYCQAWLDVVQNALDSGMKYPFYVLNHRDDRPDEKYEAVTVEELPNELDGLIDEYADSHGYRVRPRYYAEGEITSEEAIKERMYELAAEIRQQGKYTIESVTPYKYIVSSYEFDKLIHTDTIEIERPEEADCDDSETKFHDMLYNFRMQLEDKFPEYPNEDEIENFVWETLEEELGCDAVTVQ